MQTPSGAVRPLLPLRKKLMRYNSFAKSQFVSAYSPMTR